MPEAGPIPPAQTPDPTPDQVPDQLSEQDVDRLSTLRKPPPARRAGHTGRVSLVATLVLGGLTGLPPLSIDMYLPALPEVTAALHRPAATVQLTLTACLLGMALGQLIVGPMSDKWGRRRPLLAGMVVYVLATAVCAFAPSAALLIAFRLLQGLAGAAGIVIARAVVRDLYDGIAMARFFSELMLIGGLAPIVAPLIGAQVLRITDWRGVFVVLTVVGVLLTLMVWRCLRETLPPERRRTGGLGEALRTMRGLLADGPFAGYTLILGLVFAALFAYISASPFVIQEIYGSSSQTYSLLFGLNAVGIVGMGQVNGKILVGRVPIEKIMVVGMALVGLASGWLLLMASGVFGTAGLVPVAAGFFVLASAISLVLPNASTLALSRAGDAAGSASALLGASSFLIGAVASPLVGIAGDHTAVPMAVVQTMTVVLAAVSWIALCRPWRRTVDAHP